MAIEPTALAASEGVPAVREVLRESVNRHGILHLTGAEARAIRDELSDRPDEWKRWLEVLSSVPLRTNGACITVAQDVEGLGFPAGDDALAVVATDTLKTWSQQFDSESPDDELLSVPDASLECTTINSVVRSRGLQRRWEWAQADIGPSLSGDEVWDTRLAPLFRTSRSVAIVDRYLLSRYGTDVVGQPGNFGIAWLLDRIGTCNPDKQVALTLYCHLPEPAWCDPAQFQTLFADMARRCGSSISRLDLCCITDQHFLQLEHGRYLRFSGKGPGRVLRLDQSLHVVERNSVAQVVGFNYRLLSGSALDTYQRTEARLRKCSESAGMFATSSDD